MTRLRSRLAAVLLVGFALQSLPMAARAQAPAEEPLPAGGLTDESLGELLREMGLRPTRDEQRYDFKFEATHRGEQWNLSMSAVRSTNGQSVWLMAWLDPLPKSAADVPRTALLRMLADNDRLGKGKFFAYIPANRRFVLQRVVPNERMTTAKFRDALQDLGGSVADTYDHWSVANWTTDPATRTADSDDAATPNVSNGGPAPIRNATRESNEFRPTSRN